MALQKTISTDMGVDGTYIKIENFFGDKTNITFDVAAFVNEQARRDGKGTLRCWRITTPTPTGTGNDLMVDLYNHLKTLPEFSGAIDV